MKTGEKSKSFVTVPFYSEDCGHHVDQNFYWTRFTEKLRTVYRIYWKTINQYQIHIYDFRHIFSYFFVYSIG